MIDPILINKGLTNLKGKVAIASAKKAYQIYHEVFNGERFKKLKSKGAKPQRLLWASTSSKDPLFSDVKYVEPLIGKETINTITMETLEAFRDHGQAANRLEDNMDKATNVLRALKENAISIDAITQMLEDEGVEKFNRSYDKLLKVIDGQKQMLKTM
jgi:transaldolase/transaldolase/glucose-6-phosphate isomerase